MRQDKDWSEQVRAFSAMLRLEREEDAEQIVGNRVTLMGRDLDWRGRVEE